MAGEIHRPYESKKIRSPETSRLLLAKLWFTRIFGASTHAFRSHADHVESHETTTSHTTPIRRFTAPVAFYEYQVMAYPGYPPPGGPGYPPTGDLGYPPAGAGYPPPGNAVSQPVASVTRNRD